MKYSSEYIPSAPVVQAQFRSPVSSDSPIDLQAKLGTGADITVLPQSAIEDLRLMPASRVSISSFNGEEQSRYTFFVNISCLGFEFNFVEVIAGKRRDALLGRDILNQMKSVFDGKALNFDLFDP